MSSGLDIVVQLGIVDAEKYREFWDAAIVFLGFFAVTVAIVAAVYPFRKTVAEAASRLLKPRNVLFAIGFVIAVIYGSEKRPIVTPVTHSAQVKQTGTSVTNAVSATVEYWHAPWTTNGIDVVLFNGAYTNSFAFTQGQFIYAYDARTSVGTYQNPTNNPLWVREAVSSNWVSSVLSSSWSPNGQNAAVIATLPGNRSPAAWALWFIGPEQYLPAVIIESSGGIEINSAVITSQAAEFRFTGKDTRLFTGDHTYILQYRENRNGTLTAWTDLANTTLTGGTVTGTVSFVGFTVNVYREYRLVTDLEVSE